MSSNLSKVAQQMIPLRTEPSFSLSHSFVPLTTRVIAGTSVNHKARLAQAFPVCTHALSA